MSRVIELWRKFWSQPPERRRLLTEAAANLVLARTLLRCLSFQRLARIFSRPLKDVRLSIDERKRLREEVAWAILRMADHLPGMVCFPRAIAAQWMLRRRGVATTMFYGAPADAQGSLTAHVWIQDGEEGVIGMPEPYTFCVLAKFPEPR